MKTIRVFEFSEYPGLRHCRISDDSGELYYHKILNKAFKNALESKEDLSVDLDDTAGYAPSFLDEAFGNLVYDFTLEKVKKHLKVISNDEPDLLSILEDETYLQWEDRRLKKEKPKKTKKHSFWFALIDNIITEMK
jgi:hypothetical protein